MQSITELRSTGSDFSINFYFQVDFVLCQTSFSFQLLHLFNSFKFKKFVVNVTPAFSLNVLIGTVMFGGFPSLTLFTFHCINFHKNKI